MKKYFPVLILVASLIFSCNTTKTAGTSDKPIVAENETIRIADEKSEFELIIFDPKFNTWLNSYARPRNFYTQSFLEARNRVWVSEWNARVGQPRYGNIYTMPINYYGTTDYGFEVNYMLYNYLTYFQLSNKQQLGGFVPQI